MTAVDARPADDDADDEPVVRGGAWEAAFAGWRVTLPVVVGNAAVQAATVLADPVPGRTPAFAGLLLGSAASLLVAVWFTVGAADASVAGRARYVWGSAVRRPLVMVWTLGIGVVAVAASLLATWLVPVVLVLGGFLLPSPGTRSRPAAALLSIARSPVRAVLLVVLALAAAGLSAVVALLLGLFVTGPLSAAILWLWLGLVGTIVLCRYAVLARRATLRA